MGKGPSNYTNISAKPGFKTSKEWCIRTLEEFTATRETSGHLPARKRIGRGTDVYAESLGCA